MNNVEINSTLDSKLSEGKDIPDIYRNTLSFPESRYQFKKGRELAERLGYPAEVLDSLPVQTVDSFSGVGYYFDLADLQNGKKVVALEGSPEMDAFIAAKHVGSDGYVTAIHSSDERINNANSLVFVYQLENILFRKGQAEDIPVGNETTDVIISNNTIHLSGDWETVFQEAARILKYRGSLAMSSLVADKQLLSQTNTGSAGFSEAIHRIIQRDDLMNCIENAGLQIQKVNYNHEVHFLPGISGELANKSGLISISLLAYKV